MEGGCSKISEILFNGILSIAVGFAKYFMVFLCLYGETMIIYYSTNGMIFILLQRIDNSGNMLIRTDTTL